MYMKNYYRVITVLLVLLLTSSCIFIYRQHNLIRSYRDLQSVSDELITAQSRVITNLEYLNNLDQSEYATDLLYQ